MNDAANEIAWLRESLTKALITLQNVYGYAVMGTVLLSEVEECMEDAETTLQRTDQL